MIPAPIVIGHVAPAVVRDPEPAIFPRVLPMPVEIGPEVPIGAGMPAARSAKVSAVVY